jgi:formate-dependent phosphoribosylglycinamide formyltransferase (GAR transformylase)
VAVCSSADALKVPFIVKPVGSSQGKGIFLVIKVSLLQEKIKNLFFFSQTTSRLPRRKSCVDTLANRIFSNPCKSLTCVCMWP